MSLTQPFVVKTSTVRGGHTVRAVGSPAVGIELPTSRPLLAPTLFRRGRPILSGREDADQNYGFRILSSSENYLWAYRRRVISSCWWEDDTPWQDGSTAGDQALTGRMPWQFARGFTRIILHVYAEDVNPIRLRVFAVAQVDSPGVSEVASAPTHLTDAVNLANATGVDGWVQIRYTRRAGNTADIWGWEIAEMVLRSYEVA